MIALSIPAKSNEWIWAILWTTKSTPQKRWKVNILREAIYFSWHKLCVLYIVLLYLYDIFAVSRHLDSGKPDVLHPRANMRHYLGCFSISRSIRYTRSGMVEKFIWALFAQTSTNQHNQPSSLHQPTIFHSEGSWTIFFPSIFKHPKFYPGQRVATSPPAGNGWHGCLRSVSCLSKLWWTSRSGW